MNKRLIGVIIVLAVIITSVSMFILLRNGPDTEPIVKINPPTAKDLQKIEQKIKDDLAAQKAAKQQLSQKTGHRHADGTWHTDPHGTVEHSTTGMQTSTFPNLLERHTHWSDAYLPPIKDLEVIYADDPDAMFIIEKVKVILKNGGLDAHGHNPAVDKAFVDVMNFSNKVISSMGTNLSQQRCLELTRLTWPIQDTPPSYVNLIKNRINKKESEVRTKKGE